jgi:hypothetical protein
MAIESNESAVYCNGIYDYFFAEALIERTRNKAFPPAIIGGACM